MHVKKPPTSALFFFGFRNKQDQARYRQVILRAVQPNDDGR